MKRLLIFDFDGTLFRLDVDWNSLRHELHAYFSERGVEITFRPLWENIFRAVDSVSPGKKKAMSDVRAIVEGVEMRNIDKVVEMPGATSTLKLLKERGFRMAVLSCNGRLCIERTLKKFGVLEYFDAIVTRDDEFEIKPSPAAVEHLLKKFGVRKQDAVMIGDGWRDLEVARKSGIMSVIVSQGGHDEGLINKPDHVIKNIGELLEILGV